MTRSSASILVLALVTAGGAAHAVDLEPARDALRRHEYSRAVELLRADAQEGDAEAAFMLSQLLRYGQGAPKDIAEACRLLEASAGAGYSRAASSLAALLESGDCRSSARSAAEWRAAASGSGYPPPAETMDRPAEQAAPQAEQLLRAARAGDLALVQRLVPSLGPDVTDDFGRTPLMLAAEAGQVAVARELLALGASAEANDRSGETPLLIAVRKGDLALTSLLLEHGVPVNQANKAGTTALMLAAAASSREIGKRLLATGADPSLRDASGLSAGDYAARSGNAEMAARLGVRAQRPVSGDTRAGALHAGQNPLMVAAERGDDAALARGLASGTDVNATDAQGLTALAYAARAGRSTAVAELLRAGARPNTRDESGWTPLGHSIAAGELDVARQLLKGGADPRALQAGGKPLMAIALESRRLDALKMLAGAGADPDQAGTDGLPPLSLAAAGNDMNSVQALLAAGAHPERTDKRGRTALWHAASRNAVRAIPVLASRTTLDRVDNEGVSPLAAAVNGGHRESLEALLKAGANARISTRSGNTLLHLASSGGREALIPILIAARAPIDAVNTHGDTALMLGVKARCLGCARSLLSAKASTRVRNKDGLSAADIAGLTKDPALSALFD